MSRLNEKMMDVALQLAKNTMMKTPRIDHTLSIKFYDDGFQKNDSGEELHIITAKVFWEPPTTTAATPSPPETP